MSSNTYVRSIKAIKKLIKKIKEAMSHACKDMLSFTNEPAKKINAEYLFTVNVAKAINELNCYYGEPYQIFLEKDTEELAVDCIKPIIFGNTRNKTPSIIRDKNSIQKYKYKSNGKEKESYVERKGQVDIAIYGNSQDGYFGEKQPICIIECKGFDQSESLVIEDLKRNIKFLRVSGNTGKSILQFTLFTALYSDYPNSKKKGSIDTKINDFLEFSNKLTQEQKDSLLDAIKNISSNNKFKLNKNSLKKILKDKYQYNKNKFDDFVFDIDTKIVEANRNSDFLGYTYKDKEWAQEKINEINKKYKYFLDSLELEGINYNMKVFTVREEKFRQVLNMISEEKSGRVINHKEFDIDARHHFIGVIVSFHRSNAPRWNA